MFVEYSRALYRSAQRRIRKDPINFEARPERFGICAKQCKTNDSTRLSLEVKVFLHSLQARTAVKQRPLDEQHLSRQLPF